MLFRLLSPIFTHQSLKISALVCVFKNQLVAFIFKMVIVFTLFFSSYKTFSQNFDCKEDLIPMKGDNRMYGYVNLFGEWKVIPFYDRVFPFKGNIARVLKGKKYGLLDCDGKVVLRPEYDEILPFTNGYAWVKKEEKYGLIDYTGKLILEPEYEEVEDVSRFSDFAWVKKDSLWGVFSKRQKIFMHPPAYISYRLLNSEFTLVKNQQDLAGIINYSIAKPIIEPQFTTAIKVISNALAVEKNQKWGLISDEGAYLSKIEYDSIHRVHQYRLVFTQGDQHFLTDEKGQQLSKKTYSQIADYNGGAFRVKENDQYGFINYFGREAIVPQYNTATHFMEGKAIVSEKDSMYIINPKNEKITKGYQEIQRPSPNYFIFKENGLWGMMDEDVNLKFAPQFLTIHHEDEDVIIRAKSDAGYFFINSNNFRLLNADPYKSAGAFKQQSAVVSNAAGYGVIDTIKTIRIPLTYKSVLRLPNYRFALETEEGFLISDSRGQRLSTENYLEVINRDEFPLVVKTKKGYGLVNEKGIEIVDPKFDRVKSIGENYFSIQKKKNTGVVNGNGEEVLPINYEEITAFSERFFVVKKEGLWGFVDARNEVMIPFQFEAANPFEEDVARVTKENKCVLIDKRGKVLSPCE